IGRGRDASTPLALTHGDALSGHAGPVLDAIAAARLPIVLAAGASCTIDAWTGVAATRDGCVGLAQKYRDEAAGDRVLAEAHTYRAVTLQRIGASPADAAIYERLAGAVLVAAPALRADAAEIAQNRRGQSGLWGFGISGDVPVVLLQLADAAHLDLVRRLVQAHAFWKAHGIATELMIVGGTGAAADPALLDGVQQALRDAGGAELLAKAGGIFLRDNATLDDGDRTLLKSVARIVVADSWDSLLQRLELAPVPPATPATPARPMTASPVAVPGPPRREDLRDFNGHGGFTPDRREYVIANSASHMTPAPWTNVIANAEFGTLISESGSAASWSENAHEYRLTPWSNDSVGDANTEALYIRDEESGRFWSPTLLPTRSAGAYVARHGFGYSTFEHESDGIASELRVFVAIDAPVKFSRLTLRNRSGRARRLSVTGYVEWVLGDDRAKTSMQVVTAIDDGSGAIFARNAYNTDFDGRTAFFDVDGADRSACGDRRDFFGRSGSLAAPEAMNQPRLSGRVGAALDPCAALRVAIDIAAGSESTIVFRLGAGKSEDEARALVRRWRGDDTARAALAAVQAHWQKTLGTVQVRTPDPTVDTLANGWLLYQVIASRLWARTGFYQSSGAFGFRDQLQDVMALVHAEPGLVRAHLLRSAARQFVEGDVQHWWSGSEGIRTRFSDDLLWLPFAVAEYVVTTGDDAILDERVPFLKERALTSDDEDLFSSPAITEETATLYEHCARALDRASTRGAHGLPKMGSGDWNDGMNRVGRGGEGESVWLAWFLATTARKFAVLAARRGDDARVRWCNALQGELATAVDAAWDGAWYRRAWFDDGTPLGGHANVECRIDAIAQSWSVIAGIGDPAKA
ncbi:MAG TPA: cyclic beta 1-2 glucan synthetase, partial [Polyangia bacterium]|nr:cyclic beta 1-2 glucan synthetase [Polyangia bacterium]